MCGTNIELQTIDISSLSRIIISPTLYIEPTHGTFSEWESILQLTIIILQAYTVVKVHVAVTNYSIGIKGSQLGIFFSIGHGVYCYLGSIS